MRYFTQHTLLNLCLMRRNHQVSSMPRAPAALQRAWLLSSFVNNKVTSFNRFLDTGTEKS